MSAAIPFILAGLSGLAGATTNRNQNSSQRSQGVSSQNTANSGTSGSTGTTSTSGTTTGTSNTVGSQTQLGNSTQQQTQQSTGNQTNVAKPVFDTMAQPLLDELLKKYTSLIGTDPNLASYGANQVQRINQGAQARVQGLENSFASRGIAASPAASYATLAADNSRFSDVNSVMSQLPFVGMQLQQQNLGAANNFLNQFRGQSSTGAQNQTTAGTSIANTQNTGTTQQTTQSTQNQQQQVMQVLDQFFKQTGRTDGSTDMKTDNVVAGNPLGGGIAGLAAALMNIFAPGGGQ